MSGPATERRSIRELLSADVPVLMEGAVVERIRRGAPSLFDPLLANAPLIYDDVGRALLREIYTISMETRYGSSGRSGAPLAIMGRRCTSED
jgi:hypothetical protein